MQNQQADRNEILAWEAGRQAYQDGKPLPLQDSSSLIGYIEAFAELIFDDDRRERPQAIPA